MRGSKISLNNLVGSWWSFLSFEIGEDAGNELSSVLWRHKLLPPRQKVPNLITAWGFPVPFCLFCSVCLCTAFLCVTPSQYVCLGCTEHIFLPLIHLILSICWYPLLWQYCLKKERTPPGCTLRLFLKRWVDRCVTIESYLKLHLLVTGSYLL